MKKVEMIGNMRIQEEEYIYLEYIVLGVHRSSKHYKVNQKNLLSSVILAHCSNSNVIDISSTLESQFFPITIQKMFLVFDGQSILEAIGSI